MLTTLQVADDDDDDGDVSKGVRLGVSVDQQLVIVLDRGTFRS